MDFASSTWAAENRTRWKGIVANSSAVPRRPSKVMGQNRIGSWSLIFIARPVMLAVKAKIYGVLYRQSSSIAFDETSSYWSALKSSKFLGFSLVTTR